MSFFYVHLFETISLVNWYKLTNGKIIPSFFLPRTFLILFFFQRISILGVCVCSVHVQNVIIPDTLTLMHHILFSRCAFLVHAPFFEVRKKKREKKKNQRPQIIRLICIVFFFSANDNVMYRVCIEQNCERYTIPNYKLWFFVSFFPLREMIWFACWLTSCARSSIYTAYAWLSHLISFSLSITNNNQFWHV